LSDHRRLEKTLETAIPEDRLLSAQRIPARYKFDALRPYRPYPKLRMKGYVPSFLVRPETTAEISEIIRIAKRSRIPIVPYGAGTGLMGAAIAIRGGIMIDTSRMNQIEEISEEDMFVRAQSGAVLEDLYNKLQEHDLFFAHDPWTRPIATLGGAISTNSLGYLGAKYGSIGTQLLGLEAVLPDGRVLRTRPAQFSSTGLDLKRLFIGTEGSFGIVTSATIRAFPQPERFALASYKFPSFEDGYRAILTMRANDIRASMVDYGEEDPTHNEEAQLNLAFDGREGEVNAHVAKADQISSQFRGQKLEDREAQEFWDHRHDIALMFSQRISRTTYEEEPRTKYDYIHVSLMASKVLQFRSETLRIAKEHGVKVLEVGLWHGPELVSLVLSSKPGNPMNAGLKLWQASDKILVCAQDLGGSMEFCHGVGLKLAHLMEREHGLGLEIMRRFKRAVDPFGIMNPGKAGL
jgi:FAD/FMN-containing dehydrogenase